MLAGFIISLSENRTVLLKCWANIKPTQARCLAFDESARRTDTLHVYCARKKIYILSMNKYKLLKALLIKFDYIEIYVKTG